MGRLTGLLAVLAVLLIVGPALAWSSGSTAGTAGAAITYEDWEEDPGPINKGEPVRLVAVCMHGGTGHPPYIGDGLTTNIYKVADSAGNPIVPPTVLVSGGQSAIQKTTCKLHGSACDVPRASAGVAQVEGKLELHGRLAAASASPGRYRFDFIWNAAVLQITREWGNSSGNTNMAFSVKDQYGRGVPGVHIAMYHSGIPGEEMPDFAWPDTDANGQTTGTVSYGNYHIQATLAGVIEPLTAWVDHNVSYLGYHFLTVNRIGGETTHNGNATIKVVKKSDGAGITGATVTVNGVTQTVNATTFLTTWNLPAGSYTARVEAVPTTSYKSGVIHFIVSPDTTRAYVVKMSAANDPEVNTDTADNPGFWESLFVPKAATTQRWQDLLARITSWGPFGLWAKFHLSWQSFSNPGSSQPVYSYSLHLFGVENAGAPMVLDFREPVEVAYPDGTYGTTFGNARAVYRTAIGGMWYAFIAFMFFRWVRPRFQV